MTQPEDMYMACMNKNLYQVLDLMRWCHATLARDTGIWLYDVDWVLRQVRQKRQQTMDSMMNQVGCNNMNKIGWQLLLNE